MPETAFVCYDTADVIRPTGAEVSGQDLPELFQSNSRISARTCMRPTTRLQRRWGCGRHGSRRCCIHAYPIFRLYRAMGQPLYNYVVRGLLTRLITDPVLQTDLPSSGRRDFTTQPDTGRHVLHLLYGPPQVRGKEIPTEDGGHRIMEMIEDYSVHRPRHREGANCLPRCEGLRCAVRRGHRLCQRAGRCLSGNPASIFAFTAQVVFETAS